MGMINGRELSEKYPVLQRARGTGHWHCTLCQEKDAEIARLNDENNKLRAGHIEWLCDKCKVIHKRPRDANGILTVPCPVCGTAMLPTSFFLRELESYLEEKSGLQSEVERLSALIAEARENLVLARNYIADGKKLGQTVAVELPSGPVTGRYVSPFVNKLDATIERLSRAEKVE